MSVIEIFKAGRHTAQNGAAVSVLERDLAAAAGAYDPTVSEAPVVVGHPVNDAPAYGWVKALKTRAGALLAEIAQVDPAFAEAVRSGRYKKISASFYSPDSPENPKPGVWYLRHVGFLGAQAPAVKGLRPVSFSDTGAGVLEFVAQDAAWEKITNLFYGLRALLAEKFGQKAADAALPPEDVVSLAAGLSSAPGASASQSSPQAPAVQPSANFGERGALVETAAFVEGLARDGRILPRDREFLIGFLASLPAGGSVEFSEGGSMVTKPLTAAFREFLGNLPRVLDFNERSAVEGSIGGPYGELGRRIANAATKGK